MKGSIWINILVGIWLLVAPFVLGAGAFGVWTTNDIVLGVLLIAFSWWIAAAYVPPVGAAWFEIFCGVWLIAAPFVLGYSVLGVATGSDMVCGIIAIVVAATVSRAIARHETLT